MTLKAAQVCDRANVTTSEQRVVRETDRVYIARHQNIIGPLRHDKVSNLPLNTHMYQIDASHVYV